MLILIWQLFVNGSEKYPIPVYHEIDFDDGVTHLWSRQVMADHEGFAEVTKEVSKKYDGMSEDELSFLWSKKNYLDSRESLHKMINSKMDSILKRN